MENSSQLHQSISDWVVRLADSPDDPLDFDALRTLLEQTRDCLNGASDLKKDYAILRSDLEQRIAGMIKAIAVVDRKRDRWQDAVDLIDSLPGYAGSDLLTCYRKTQARFRDFFPTSFAHLENTRYHSSRSNTDTKDFK